MLTGDDPLRILGLPSHATRSDVKRAYRNLVRQHHPDVGGDPDVFRIIQQAYAAALNRDASVPPDAPLRIVHTPHPLRFTSGRF